MLVTNLSKTGLFATLHVCSGGSVRSELPQNWEGKKTEGWQEKKKIHKGVVCLEQPERHVEGTEHRVTFCLSQSNQKR